MSATSDSSRPDRLASEALPQSGDGFRRAGERGAERATDKPSPVGYYMLHSCADTADHQDACDAVFVWASSPEEALALDPDKGRDPETVEVQRREEADKFRKVLGLRFGNGWGKEGPDQERAYREMGFHEDGGTSCDSCGLWEFPKVPESKVCRECLSCAECACVCGERLCDAERDARVKAFNDAITAARAKRTTMPGFAGEGHAYNDGIDTVIAELEELRDASAKGSAHD